MLGREHEQPDVFIVESHHPTDDYAEQVRNNAKRGDTQFCQNGHDILAKLMQGTQRDIPRLNFLLRNTREPELLGYLDEERECPV